MASVITLPMTAPAVPKGYSPPSTSTSKITPPHPTGHRTLLPVGIAHLNHLRLALHHGHNFESFDAFLEAEREAKEKLAANENGFEDDLGVGDEEESEELLAQDPKEWKKQDNYAVLGLSKFRYLATPDQIKIAHRKKVLKHHPDKKASSTTAEPISTYLGITQNTNDDAFFKCIQKAHEVLTNPEKKRQFDSVDPELLELEEKYGSITEKEFKAKKKDFFKTFSPIFKLWQRFSRVQPVPGLGHPNSTKEEVEGFYDFWYNFDSWRSFEWWDKEINEGSDNRDDKRYTEKKNKTERARRKKEDTAKVRAMVDLALSLDPRIKRIKDDEKKAREAKKAAAAAAAGKPVQKTKAQLEEEKKKAEEEAKKKEEEEKVAKAEAKKAKAAAANAAKKARRAARATEDGEA